MALNSSPSARGALPRIHKIERYLGFHSRSVDASCSCGWTTEQPDILSRARTVMAHLKSVNANPRTGIEEGPSSARGVAS